jgi:hypothetical protein
VRLVAVYAVHMIDCRTRGPHGRCGCGPRLVLANVEVDGEPGLTLRERLGILRREARRQVQETVQFYDMAGWPS